MRRSLLIHLHISESKWYQRQNKTFWWDPDHSRIWSSKQVIEDSEDRRHMLPRNFLQTLKYSEKFLAQRKEPSKGYLWKSFHVPCSDLGLHTEQQMASGDALHIKLPPWHRIPPKPPRHFSESKPRIWLWGRVSGEDRFDHSARVDAVLVKAYCIAPGSESDNYYIVSQGCRLAGPCLRRFGQHTAISTLCSYFPRWWSAGLGLVSIRATSTLRL